MTKDHLTIQVVAPGGEIWAGRALAVRAPGSEGCLGVRPGHVPFACLLGTGRILVRPVTGDPFEILVDGGFLLVDQDVVTVLPDTASIASSEPVATLLAMPHRFEPEREEP